MQMLSIKKRPLLLASFVLCCLYNTLLMAAKVPNPIRLLEQVEQKYRGEKSHTKISMTVKNLTLPEKSKWKSGL